jgi:hypothetical protein
MPVLESILVKGIVSAMIAYSAHYAAIKAYDNYCVPDGFWGYFTGMAATGSPICQATLNVATQTQNSFGALIIMGISRIFIDLVAPGSAASASGGTETPK